MRRSRLKIVAEILELSRKESKKTRIKSSCNLSNSLIETLVIQLLEADLLRHGNSFHKTKKGILYLQAYKELESLLMEKR